MRSLLTEQVDQAIDTLSNALLKVRKPSQLKDAFVSAAQSTSGALSAALRAAPGELAARARALIQGVLDRILQDGIAASAAFTSAISSLQSSCTSLVDSAMGAAALIDRVKTLGKQVLNAAMELGGSIAEVPDCVGRAVARTLRTLWDWGAMAASLAATLDSQLPNLPALLRSEILALGPDVLDFAIAAAQQALLAADLPGVVKQLLAGAPVPDFVAQLLPGVMADVTAALGADLAVLSRAAVAVFKGEVTLSDVQGEVASLTDRVLDMLEAAGPEALLPIIKRVISALANGPLKGLRAAAGGLVSGLAKGLATKLGGDLVESLQEALGAGDGDIIVATVAQVSDWVARTLTDPVTAVLSGVVAPAVRGLAERSAALGQAVVGGLFSAVQRLLQSAQDRLQPKVTALLDTGLAQVRSAFRLPGEMLAVLQQTVQTTARVVLTAASGELSGLVDTAVRLLPLDGLPAADVTLLVTLTTTQVTRALDDAIAGVRPLALSGVERVQQCVATFLTPEHTTALLEPLTHLVLGDIPAALSAVLDTVGHLLTDATGPLLLGLAELVDFLAAEVQDAPAMLGDTVVEVVAVVRGVLATVFDEQVEKALVELLRALLSVRSAGDLKEAVSDAANTTSSNVAAALRAAPGEIAFQAKRLVMATLRGVVQRGVAASSSFTTGLELLGTAVKNAVEAAMAAVDLVGLLAERASGLFYDALEKWDLVSTIPGAVTLANDASSEPPRRADPKIPIFCFCRISGHLRGPGVSPSKILGARQLIRFWRGGGGLA